MSRADRAVEMADVRSLADKLDALALDVLRRLLGISALGLVFLLDALAVGLEDLAVRFVGAERLLAREEVVAGEPVLHLHHVADGAELLDALKQNDFHVERSLFHDVGKQADVTRALDRARHQALAPPRPASLHREIRSSGDGSHPA